jgi:hypothetical protein
VLLPLLPLLPPLLMVLVPPLLLLLMVLLLLLRGTRRCPCASETPSCCRRPGSGHIAA